MHLPRLNSPEKYTGLYIFDFGEQVAVGYTADEVAVLLESEAYAEGKVYRIHRALPDGTMELAGVAREKFNLEDGLLFWRQQVREARADFEELRRAAADIAPPCRMKLQLAKIDGAAPAYLSALIFPAEFTHDVADWLHAVDFDGGDVVEGGPSQVSDYYHAQPLIIDRHQLWSASSGTSRQPEEVLASVHEPIQRKFA